MVLLLSLLSTYVLRAQDIQGAENQLKVFVDCRTNCDRNYFRTKLPYINYVRDQGLADVHVLINSLSTASGGRKYTMQFITKNGYSEAPIQEVIFDTPPNATQDDVRSMMTTKLGLGLVPFLINTPTADLLRLVGPELEQEEIVEKNASQSEFDPWDYWVFEAGFDVDAELQSNRNEFNIRTDFDITRITDKWRISNFFYYRNDRQRFIKEEGDIISVRKRYGFFGRTIKSLNDHWSIGTFQSASHNTFSNFNFQGRIGPAIEYSIFPYQEAIYKEFTIAYFTRVYYQDYIEETIYQKKNEVLWDQQLQIALRMRMPWGSIRSELRGRHFFQDFSKNSIEFENNINVRIFKGLAVRLNASYELVNDQLSLPRQELTLEELLLAQRAQATDYEFRFSVGLNYTFGSIYNNIINTRL